jgi:hypothetical protein
LVSRCCLGFATTASKHKIFPTSAGPSLNVDMQRVLRARLKFCQQARPSAIIDIFRLVAQYNPPRPLRKAAYTDRSCPELSAYVGDVFLGICFWRDRLLRGQLKHRCRLTLTQDRQQRDPPIGELERIVMCG